MNTPKKTAKFILLIIFSFTMIIQCAPKQATSVKTSSEYLKDIRLSKSGIIKTDNIVQTPEFNKNFFKWIDKNLLVFIKSLSDCKINTATHLSTSIDYLYKPDYAGHYGVYFLHSEKYRSLGTMIIYEPDSVPGWNCTDTNELFISYFLSDTIDDSFNISKIKFYNKIYLTMQKDSLTAILGEPQQKYKNKLIYHNYKDYIAIFDIKNKKILSILIARYKLVWKNDSLIDEKFLDKIDKKHSVIN